MVSQPYGYAAWRGRNRGQEWLLLALAIWLFISPWVLQFGAVTAGAAGAASAPMIEASRAAWDAWVLGVIVFLVALSAIGRLDVRQEWIILVLGAWIFVAPWVLRFTPLPRPSWDHWVVGALVSLIALWTLSGARAVPVDTVPPRDGRPPVPPVVPPGNRVP